MRLRMRNVSLWNCHGRSRFRVPNRRSLWICYVRKKSFSYMSAMLSFASFSASSFVFDIVSLLLNLCYIFLKIILLSLIYFIIYLLPGITIALGVKTKIVLVFCFRLYSASALFPRLRYFPSPRLPRNSPSLTISSPLRNTLSIQPSSSIPS